jgi:hypothetical protein
MLLNFQMNSLSGHAVMYKKYKKARVRHCLEKKKTRCHASSEKFKKNFKDLKVPKHTRWMPGFPKPCDFQDFGKTLQGDSSPGAPWRFFLCISSNWRQL